MQTFRKAARERMKGYCRVCPVCNGIACVGEVPGMGGIGTGAALNELISAMVLTGCPDMASVGRDILRPPAV